MLAINYIFKMAARIRRLYGVVPFVIICLIYLIFIIPAPGLSLADAGHDDGLFMQWSISILNLQWLGPWNVLTTAKGSLHSLLTAVAANFGVNPFFYRKFFYLLAALIFVLTGLKKAPDWLKCLTLLSLLFDPFQFSQGGLRNLREGTYIPLQLMAIGFGSLSLDYLRQKFINKKMLVFAIIGTSLCFGLILVTREARVIAWIEFSIWLLLGGLLAAWRIRKQIWRHFGLAALCFFFCIFTIVELTKVPTTIFTAVNNTFYHAAISNSTEEGEFPRFYGRLISIGLKGDSYIPRVPVKQSLLNAIIKESSDGSPLNRVLKKLDPAWKVPGCNIYPQTCSEFGGGWFLWALRASIATNLQPGANEDSFQKFVKLADIELDLICKRANTIFCAQPRVGYMPSINRWGFVSPFMEAANEGIRIASLVTVPSVNPLQEPDYLSGLLDSRHKELASPLGIPSSRVDELAAWHGVFRIARLLGATCKWAIICTALFALYLAYFPSRVVLLWDLVSIWMLFCLSIHIATYALVGLTSFPGDVYVAIASPIFIAFLARTSAWFLEAADHGRPPVNHANRFRGWA